MTKNHQSNPFRDLKVSCLDENVPVLFHRQVRVDSGIQEGSDISIYYDPMISKVSDV